MPPKKPVVAGLTASIDSIAGPDINLRRINPTIITRAIPGNLPDYIEINIADLDIGHSVFIKDLRVDEYTFLAADNAVVVGVRTARELIIEEEEEEELEGEEGVEGEEGAEGEATEGAGEAAPSEGGEEKPTAE